MTGAGGPVAAAGFHRTTASDKLAGVGSIGPCAGVISKRLDYLAADGSVTSISSS